MQCKKIDDNLFLLENNKRKAQKYKDNCNFVTLPFEYHTHNGLQATFQMTD